MFKPGDKVFCIDPIGECKLYFSYTIASVSGTDVKLVGVEGFYAGSRFQLIESTPLFKTGDKVICVDNQGRAELDLGVYTV